MAGRLYRMAKVVSANPASWGIVDANQISGFRTVATKTDLYSIAACILSSSYGDGTTTGADALGQVWHVQEDGKDYRLINWAKRGTSEGWTEELTSTLLVGKINAAENKADSAINKANTNAATITTLSGKIEANASAINKKADTTTVNTVKENVAINKQNITTLTTQLQTTNKNLADFIALKGAHSGLAELDKNGYIPLGQLGNIETTLFEVITTDLPSTIATIKKHIYLKAAGTTGDKNNYAEYVYTGDLTPTATYDATKWEKLGEVSAKTDLSEYYKKSESYSAPLINAKVAALNNADIKSITSAIEVDNDDELKNTNSLHIKLTRNDTTKVLDLKLPNATAESSGIMPKGYVSKIDEINTKLSGIEAEANKTIVDSEFSATSTNPVQNKTISTWKNTTEKNIDSAFRLIAANKSKLDTIDEHANNYSHPTHTAAAEGLYKVTVDSLGHVSHTTAVTKEDITDLGIPGSAPTVDTAMSNTSINAVQNKVIDNAIRTHKVNKNNFSNIDDLNSSHTSLLFHSDDTSAVNYIDRHNCCYSIFDVDDSNGVPKIAYSLDGGLSPMSYLLTDLDVVALSVTDVNDILNGPI